MAEFIIPIKSEEIKAEIIDAFVTNFANHDNLSPEELARKHISNFIRHQLNEKRINTTLQTAAAAIVKEVSISPEIEETQEEAPVKKKGKKKSIVEEVPVE